MYRSHSPAQSTTSVSDCEEDEILKSTFLPGNPIVFSPAQWASKSYSPSFTRSSQLSPMSSLPPEVLIHILKHLHSIRDLYSVLQVSKTWCECSVELLWHKPNFQKLSTLVKVMQVLSRPEQTFPYARFIRRLNFLSLGAELTDSPFLRLAQCDRLERLTLVNCHSISEDALARVLPFCVNLVAIDLTGVVKTTDRVIVGLALAAKRLQGINLGSCTEVTDIGVNALAKSCPLLRRVKLSGLESITDEPVSALAKRCPLLLEIDLNNCKKITDVSIRDVWTYSTHMREMRLSQCAELTDSAFPAPLRPDGPDGPDPFPFPRLSELPPLVLSRPFDHLRMLDLTGCALLTDDAVEGIISHAPKIRSLVLSKCVLLSDRSVENICRLGKHLHYLHLGHAASVTDRSVRTLSRCCTRLRYVDFANCVHLTDMSVFELSSLPRLRRIGLVRVNNLTDEAIYSLADRHGSLERIHLSYCDQISVMAIHFLLQKLHKLTHLSLTGIPSFRKPELQRFCRAPPQEFNLIQRSAFVVYSGKGVSELRNFLSELFEQITDTNGADETEYEEDFDDTYNEDTPEEQMEVDNEREEEDRRELRAQLLPQPGVINEAFLSRTVPQPNLAMYRGHRLPNSMTISLPRQAQQAVHLVQQRAQSPRTGSFPVQVPSRDMEPPRVITLANGSDGQLRETYPIAYSNEESQLRIRGFGRQPVVEDPAPVSRSPPPRSPPQSDVASVGTNQSNGAGFFRGYQESAGPTSPVGNDALTPDLVFAEIGHGRGTAVAGSNGAPGGSSLLNPNSRGIPIPHGITQVMQHPMGRFAGNPDNLDRQNAIGTNFQPVYMQRTTQGAQRHRQAPLALRNMPVLSPEQGQSQQIRSTENGEGVEGRGRSVKRFKNTLNAAEYYASSFFGKGGPNSHDSNGGGASGSGSGVHSGR